MKVQNKYIVIVLLLTAAISLIPLQCFADVNNNTQNIHNCSTLSLDQPCVSDADVLALANNTALAIYNYNYQNYNTAFKTASQYFTPDGWQSFIQALNTSGILQNVLTKQLSVSAVAIQPPSIEIQRAEHGIYQWQTTQQILVTFKSKHQTVQQSLTCEILIRRIPSTLGARGISVVTVVAK